MGRAMGEAVKRGLNLDEDQEDIVDHAMKDAESAVRDFTTVVKDSREDLAAAFSGDEVDDAVLTASFATHDEELAKARRQLVSAFKQVHAVLDDEQRERAAEWLATGPKWWR